MLVVFIMMCRVHHWFEHWCGGIGSAVLQLEKPSGECHKHIITPSWYNDKKLIERYVFFMRQPSLNLYREIFESSEMMEGKNVRKLSFERLEHESSSSFFPLAPAWQQII